MNKGFFSKIFTNKLFLIILSFNTSFDWTKVTLSRQFFANIVVNIANCKHCAKIFTLMKRNVVVAKKKYFSALPHYPHNPQILR